MYIGFWWGNPKERDNFEGPGVEGGDNIKMGLQEVRCGGMDRIDMAQDGDRWRAQFNEVMNIWSP